MATSGLTSGSEFLRDAARVFFNDLYENPKMYLDQELHRDLLWTPALRFTIRDHVNVFVEPSETGPYPRIFQLKATEVRDFPQPIAVYVVCPKNVTKKQADVNRLRADGFGLITVGPDGQATMEFPTIPLVQIISKAKFREEINGLPLRIRQRTTEAFQDYCNQPVNGVKTLSEVVEGLVTRAGKDSSKKGFLSKNQLGNTVATMLNALYGAPEFQQAQAAVGGVRSYMAQYRNLTHHWPKNKKDAYKKYADCRHGFLEGLKQMQQFRAAMKNAGLSGNL